MNSVFGWIMCAVLPALLTACAGNAQAPIRSEAQSQAATQLERGIRARNKGENVQAGKYLADALRISSAIEDNPSRITALINLARLDRLNDNLKSAALHIDQALRLVSDAPEAMPEAAYEKALIELAQNHCAEALVWADRSLSSASGDEKGRRLNVLARIHLAAGNKNEAGTFATAAREESRRTKDAHEESNSLRLLGSIERENGRFDEAGRLLREALVIDKQIGDSRKIALDLEELAALADVMGDMNLEVDYLERAFSVHINGARLAGAAKAQLKIAEIFRKSGNNILAEKAAQTAEQLIQKNSADQISSESASPSNRP